MDRTALSIPIRTYIHLRMKEEKMKTWQISGFLAVLILGVLLASGCSGTGSPGVSTNVAPSTVTTAATMIPVSVVPITLVSDTAAPTSVTPTPVQAYTTNDINKHFVDVTFGPDTSRITKWTGDFVDIGISGAYTDTDVKILNNFSKLFNSYSSMKLASEVTEERMTANIVLRFLPESSLKNVNADDSWKIARNPEMDTIIFIYKETPDILSSETIFINSDFRGDERTHWILRALLYELGFTGETGTYTDSIFYSGSGTTTSLSRIDLKVVELMYGKKITNGMTLSQVQDLLFSDR